MSTPPTLDYLPPPVPQRPPRWHWLKGAGPPFIAGLFIGVSIWVLSPEPEAWDSPYYVFAVFGGGFAAACLGPRRFWAAPIGIYVGQMLYVFGAVAVGELQGGPLWLLGLIVGAAFTSLALAGAAVVLGLFHLLRLGR